MQGSQCLAGAGKAEISQGGAAEGASGLQNVPRVNQSGQTGQGRLVDVRGTSRQAKVGRGWLRCRPLLPRATSRGTLRSARKGLPEDIAIYRQLC
eukprot:3852452-Pleurochrysis_carterae.AAC.2